MPPTRTDVRSPQPWTHRRIAAAAAAWSALAVARVAVASYASWAGTGRAPAAAEVARTLAFNGGLALLWTAMTPAIGALVLQLRRAPPAAQLVAHAAAVLAVAGADATGRRTLLLLLGRPAQVDWTVTALYYLDLTAAAYLAVVVATRALAAHDGLVARHRHALALRGDVARARLAFLDLQLQPHFLFNALGSVAELAHEAPAAAARMLRQLARLLRSVVRGTGPEVTLREEIETLEPYLEIQRTRFADWLAFDVRVAPGAEAAVVPRLVLQPLVENAIEHGLRGRTAPGRITIDARITGDALRVAIHDNGRGLQAASAPRAGIGLANVRARLASLHGARARLSLSANAEGGATSELLLPLRTERPGTAIAREPAAPTDASDDRALRFLRDHAAATVVIGWLLWGAAWMQQSVAYLALRGRLTTEAFLRALTWNAAGAALWALLTPVVFAIAARMPLAGVHRGRRLALHLAAGLAIGTVHAWLLALARPGSTSARAVDPTMLLWNVVAYAVLVALAEYRGVIVAAAEHAVAESRLVAELEESRYRAAALRTRPEQLLETLESMAEEVERSPAGADASLAALGAELRLLLDETREARRRVEDDALVPEGIA
jgi:two-component sensor histidine kinase